MKRVSRFSDRLMVIWWKRLTKDLKDVLDQSFYCPGLMGVLNLISTAIKNHSENDQATAGFSMWSCCTLGVSAKLVVIFCYCRTGCLIWGRVVFNTYYCSSTFHCTQNLPLQIIFITIFKKWQSIQNVVFLKYCLKFNFVGFFFLYLENLNIFEVILSGWLLLFSLRYTHSIKGMDQ